MILITLITLFLQFRTLNCQGLDHNGISLAEKVLEISRLMLTAGTIDFQVAPCEFLLNGPPSSVAGDQTSAQWVRTVFHDFITANVTAGTGGLDASVGFESQRPENLGTTAFDGENFIDRTIIGFNLFSNVFISTSDFIGLGLAEAVLSCDPNSPMIQLRAGRIDASGPGPSGVPTPSESFPQQLAAFANAGFSQTEMIQAVACGHSLGGVHNVSFPQIVEHQAPLVGMSGVDYFDDTPFVFDNAGVSAYLSGVGKAGGPLVTTDNKAFQSDKNIFESDGNTTIKAMATSQKSFENACFPIFEKMINTVPKTVTLSDPIGPSPWLTMWAFLDLTSTGVVTYSGTIATYGKAAAPKTATYSYSVNHGGSIGPKTSQPGELQSNLVDGTNDATRFSYFGNVTFYSFNDTFNTPADLGIDAINIQGYSELINQNLFVVPSLSFVNPSLPPVYLIRAALLTTLYTPGLKLTGTLYYPAGQNGSFSIAYKQATTSMTKYTTMGNYTIFQSYLTQPVPEILATGGGGSHIDVQLGTTLRSPKAQALFNVGHNIFTSCLEQDLTACKS